MTKSIAYALAIRADCLGGYRWGAAATWAGNDLEATGKGLEICQRQYPPEQGFYNHQVAICPLTVEWLREALNLSR